MNFAFKEKIYKALHEKNSIQRYVARRFLFGLFEKLGFHIIGDHFYEIIPNTRFVRKHYTDAPRPIAGLSWNLPAYEAKALELLRKYGGEFRATVSKFGYVENNAYFCGFDALMLYTMVRDEKPRRVVEIGQGVSTRILLAALDKNHGETGVKSTLVTVDPYVRLSDEAHLVGVHMECVRKEIQQLDPVQLLDGCDFLLVDSSHVYKFGSDVEFEFCQLYGNIGKGALIHIHDIFSPYAYPLWHFTRRRQFWNEQYILENFLSYNAEFEVALPLHLLFRQSSAFLEAAGKLDRAPDFKSHAMSFYIRRKP